MAINTAQLLKYGAGGAIGAGAGQLLGGYKNPADSATKYMDQIPGQIHSSFDPYVDAGKRQLPGLEDQYSKLMTDPGGRLNEIGGSYHQSPGFQFALDQALQGAGHASAAGGMAGSPQHEQQSMGIATHLADQDYNQYMQNALGLYGKGMEGSQSLYNTGATAGMTEGQDLASVLANKSKLAYEGQNAENEHNGGSWGSILGGIGSLAAFL